MDAFVRVRFVSYWVDKDGNVVGKPSEMPEISYNSNYWIKSSNEYEYYCINDVSPGEQTPELLKANIVLSSDIYDEEEVYQVVDVFAEAIQSNPVSAVESAWKVEVGDAAGKIEKVL